MLPRPSIMGERNPSIDDANAPRTCAATVNATKRHDLFADVVGSATLPPVRSSCSTDTVCAAPCPVTRRSSSDVNTVGPTSTVAAPSASIRGSSLCEEGGNASSLNRRNGAFDGDAVASLRATQATPPTVAPRLHRRPRASGRVSPVGMTVAVVARQCSPDEDSTAVATKAAAAGLAAVSTELDAERASLSSGAEGTAHSAIPPSCALSRRISFGAASRPHEETTPSLPCTVVTPPPPPLRCEVGMFQLEYVDRDGAVQQRLSAFVNYCGKGPSMELEDAETVFAAQLGPFLREPRQFREMVVEMIEKNAAAAAAAAAAAVAATPATTTHDGAADGTAPGDAVDTADAAAAVALLDAASMSGTVFNALRPAAALVGHPPAEPTYRPQPRFVFERALRTARELCELHGGQRTNSAKFSGRQLDAALTAAKANAAGAGVSAEDATTPRRPPGILLTPITTPPASRGTAGAAAGPVARRPIPFTSALPTFQAEASTGTQLDHLHDPREPLTPLQVKAHDLCGAEMAARKMLWTTFLADRYELFVMKIGIVSTYAPVNLPLDRKPSFDVVLSLMSHMVQRYLDVSLEASLVWIADAYLAVYTPRPVLRSCTATSSSSSSADAPEVRPQGCAPLPIAARTFKSVLAPPSPCAPLPPSTGLPLRALTALPPAAPLTQLLASGPRHTRHGVKDPLPTFRSFVKRHPRGLPCLGALSYVPVFTPAFLLRVSLKVLDEFATLPHMTVPPVVATAVQMLLPAAARSTSAFSDSFVSVAATMEETLLPDPSSVKTGTSLAVCSSGDEQPDTSATFSSVELVPQRRGGAESPQTAFWRLLRRWNTTPTPPAHTSAAAAAVVGAGARPAGVTPYAAALVALRQIFRFYHSEAASSAATDSPISIRQFFPLPGVTFERVAAMVRVVMLSSEFYASVEAAADSHFGFRTRLRHYRSIGDESGAVGPQHMQRLLRQCAQEAVNLSAAVHEVWWQAREWWLTYVQSAFRATAPVRRTAPCVLSGVNIAGLHLPGSRALPVEPRRPSGQPNPPSPSPPPPPQSPPPPQRRQRSPCPSSSVRQWPTPASERVSSAAPFVSIIASPLSSPPESLIAVAAAAARADAADEDAAAGGRTPLTARSPMPNMAPSFFGQELSCGSPPSVTSSENSSSSAVVSELREATGTRAAVLVPAPPATRLVDGAARGPAATTDPLGTRTTPATTRRHWHDTARTSRHTETRPPRTGRATDAFLATVPPTPVETTTAAAAPEDGGAVQDGPPRAARLAVPLLKSLLSSRFTGAAAEWDLAILLRREAYERAVAAAQQTCEARLLQGWAADSALALQTARHLSCVVAGLHDVWLVYRRGDPSRHFWDQVCMEKQMLVNRWVKQRADMQFQFFAVAVHRSQAELQLEGIAHLADEFKTLVHVARRRQLARRPTQSPCRIVGGSASTLPRPLAEASRPGAALPPSSTPQDGLGDTQRRRPPTSTTAAVLSDVRAVPPPTVETPAPAWQPHPFDLWGYGRALPPADSPMGLRDGVVIMTRLCRDLQLGGRLQCTNWFRTDDADDQLQRFRGDFHELRYANRDEYVGYTRVRLPGETTSGSADAFEDAASPTRGRHSFADTRVDGQLGGGELLRHGPGHYTAPASGYTYVGGWSDDRPHGDGALLFKGALPWEAGADAPQTSMRLVFGQWQWGQLMHVELQFSGETSPQ